MNGLTTVLLSLALV